jgi:hypothetical protein
LQYIGPFGNNSHSQTSIKVLQKGSHSRLYLKELNSKAENGVHKNFDAYLKCLHKQIYKNIVIENGTILVNEKGQPVGISLINNFTASATNIEVYIPSGRSSNNQT